MNSILQNFCKKSLKENVAGLIARRNFYFFSLKPKPKTTHYMVMRAKPENFNEILDLMWKCYYPEEPCTKALGLGYQRNIVFDDHVRQMLYQGYSVVAKCKYNGCIVGGMINGVACPWDPELTERMACTLACPNMRELYMFWAYVSRAPDLWKKYCTPNIFEMANLFVSKADRNQGLGKQITKKSLEIAADSGFRLVRVDCTNLYTQKLSKSLGMTFEYDIPFCSYIGANNEPIFMPTPPHDIDIKIYIARPFAVKLKK